jgi:hypothetical protein
MQCYDNKNAFDGFILDVFIKKMDLLTLYPSSLVLLVVY